MDDFNRFMGLLSAHDVNDWSQKLFEAARYLGFDQALFALLPSTSAPLETAFIKSNYSEKWRAIYDQQKFAYIDPTVTHCLTSNIPLIWANDTFIGEKVIEVYEEARSHNLASGIIYPIHGPSGEFGLLSVISDAIKDPKYRKELVSIMPKLAMFKDYAFESALKFLGSEMLEKKTQLSSKELEVIKWTAAGKTAWEIGKILNSSENTINYHMKNIRQKLGVTSKHQAIAKCIAFGLITP